MLSGLAGREFQDLARTDAPPASRTALESAHTPAHVAAILDRFGRGSAEGLVRIDGDTVMSAGSAEAALRAAGAVTAAVDLVMTGSVRNAFCAVRPPGHHAEKARAMGFCLFNNVAVGAFHARAEHGLKRVAVVDFDVHHGNGTQDIAWSDPDFFYASSHQFPLYPGTGSKAETGVVGNVVNAPLPPGADGPEFRQAWESRIFPALTAFAPDFLFISAGFDGPPGRSPGQHAARRVGLRLGHRRALRDRPRRLRGPRCFRLWKAAMTSKPCGFRLPPMSAR